MAERRIAAGVDLGGTKILSLVATEDGAVLGEDRRLTLVAEGAEAVIGRVEASARAAIEAAGLRPDALVGIGVSSPGPVDTRAGIVTHAPNVGLHQVPLAHLLRDAFGVPVLLENDAAAAAYGEFRFGAGRGYRHLLYVTLSTGIGGGIIIDGQVYRGASGAAGEVGHLILDENGPRCNCGNRGCLEAFASGVAIAREARRAIDAGRSSVLAEIVGENEPDAERVRAAAERGDPVAREIIARAGHYLGLGLAGLLNVLDPEVLILGGGLLGLGDAYLGPALQAARAGAFEQIVRDVTITQVKLGERAGALGAAALMLDTER